MSEARAVISVSVPLRLLTSAHEFMRVNYPDYPSLSSLVSRAIAEKIKFNPLTINKQ